MSNSENSGFSKQLLEKLWKTFSPFIRPSRILVLIGALSMIMESALGELSEKLRTKSLIDYKEIIEFFVNAISIYDLILAVGYAFLLNPLVTAVVVRVGARILRKFAGNLMARAYGIWMTSKQGGLLPEDRMAIFNRYRQSKAAFILCRELLELIIPASFIVFRSTNDSLTGSIYSALFAFLLFWMLIQWLLIRYLRDIVPYELIRPTKREV